jgi:hypothetical protein
MILQRLFAGPLLLLLRMGVAWQVVLRVRPALGIEEPGALIVPEGDAVVKSVTLLRP